MLISKKIWLLVAIAMVTSAALSSFGLYGLKAVNSNMVEIAGKSVPALLKVSDMRTSYLALIPQLYNRATTNDAEKGKVLEQALDKGNNDLIVQINAYGEKVTDENEKQALDEAKLSLISFVTRLKQINTLAGLGETQTALEMVQRDIGPLVGGADDIARRPVVVEFHVIAAEHAVIS